MEPSTTSSPVNSQFKRYYQRISPLLKKPKMQASTAAVFSFLAVSLFLWYAVRPTAQTIIFLQREIADKTVLNQQMEAKITALIEAQATYENIKDRLTVLDDALPHNPDAVILARQLKNIARASEASISAIQIPSVPILASESTPGAKLVSQKPLQEFPVTVVVSGNYPEIKAFLNGILSLRRITSVDMLTIKQGKSLEVGQSVLQLSVRLKSYYSIQ